MRTAACQQSIVDAEQAIEFCNKLFDGMLVGWSKLARQK